MRRAARLAIWICALTWAFAAQAALPFVTVTYRATLPSGGYPAALSATAEVTWMSVSDPALVNRPVKAAYDPATGTATWSLPASCQARFRCPSTGLDEVYSIGAADMVLNALVPVSAPAVQPAWASLFEPAISGDGVSTDYWGGDKLFHPLPPSVSLSASNAWTAPQEFDGGFVAGGAGATDVAPMDGTVSAPSAYPLAVTHTSGGNLYLAGGLGTVTIAIADYTQLADSSVYLTLNLGLPDAITYTLTEGIQFSAVTDDGTTAAALATAINAWCPGLYAMASGALVGLQKTAGTVSVSIATTSASYVVAAAPTGNGYLVGPWHSTGSLSLDGTTQAIAYPHTHVAGEIALSVARETFVDVTSGTSLWSPALIGGVPGQIVILTFEDAFFTLTDGGPAGAYNLNGNFTSTTGATLVLIYTGTQWREISRSLN